MEFDLLNEQEKIIGSFFDDCARRGYMSSFDREELNKLDKLLKDWDLAPGDRVFEPGCGSGRLTELIAKFTGDQGVVYSCDLSPAMISLARERKIAGNAVIYHGSATEIPVQDNFFDKILLFQVFPHFNDKPRALREIRRALKISGHLWINHLKSRAEINTLHNNSSGIIISHEIPDENEMRALLESSGFSVDYISDTNEGYGAHALKI
jgi:ubiquinone/menaquinone biosynthesis C-methylase UbiE